MFGMGGPDDQAPGFASATGNAGTAPGGASSGDSGKFEPTMPFLMPPDAPSSPPAPPEPPTLTPVTPLATTPPAVKLVAEEAVPVPATGIAWSKVALALLVVYLTTQWLRRDKR